MEDVAQKCALPVSLLNTGQRSVNGASAPALSNLNVILKKLAGLPVRALNLLRHGEQLVVTIEAPPDFDPDAASSALAQEEAMLQEELSALEAARRKEMVCARGSSNSTTFHSVHKLSCAQAVKEAEDAAFAQRLAEEEDAERAKGRLVRVLRAITHAVLETPSCGS